jgi:hypothetical protein
MPDFTFSQALTANQRDFRPLANWKYRRLAFRALVTILINATTAGVLETIDTGTSNIKQRSPVTANGVAGIIPIHFNTPVIQFVGSPFDELIISLDEILAGTPTVNGYLNVEPA